MSTTRPRFDGAPAEPPSQPTQVGAAHPPQVGAAHPTQFAASQVALDATFGAVPDEAPPPEPGAANPDDLPEGTLVGEYQVTRKLGEGGMGAVFAAVHPLIGRMVAIKVINSSGGTLLGASARFLQEARAASLVRHRNIVDVFAFGQLHDGRSYLVMEFLEGEMLSSYLYRKGPLSYREALPIMEGILAGLGAAHAKGVVHRDLKPDNIWILPPEAAATPTPTEDPDFIDPLRIKLVDFGLAKVTTGDGANQNLTRAGAPMGTPAFMSPEQCRGDLAIDARTDIYALGVLLYEMFSLQVPFSGETFIEILNLHLTAPPPSLEDVVGMPPDLQDVIETALAKDPARRYQTAAELLAALHKCDSARDWSPRGAGEGALHEGESTQFQAPTAVAEPGGQQLPSLSLQDLLIRTNLDGDTLRLTLSGELDDGADIRPLAAYLGDIVGETEELGRVVIDVSDVSHFGMAPAACLQDWLGFLAEAYSQGLSPTTIRYREGTRWQRAAVPTWRRANPALRTEATD